jgi:ferredoxin-NADP reductase/ferredoxin
MATLHYSGSRYETAAGETVLECLERHGQTVAHSCRSGICQSCLLRAVEGTVPAAAQQGLRENRKQQCYFLACMARPDNDLRIELPGEAVRLGVTVAELSRLSETVLRVRLMSDRPLVYRPGQYVTFLRPGLARSYSIASLPDEPALEFHVRQIAGGRMSGWLHAGAGIGDAFEVQGPQGECFYTAERKEQPLLLAGAGTGLAPLYGIVRDALQQGHTGAIRLYHGARTADGLYLVDDLRALAAQYPQLHYEPTTAPLLETILAGQAKWGGWRGYFCGDPALVGQLKKQLFLAGMAMRDIYADAFVPAAGSS